VLVDDLLAASADRRPDKTAVVCDGERWTYRQLDDASSRVAGWLMDGGVAPGDRVAIWLENSIASVAAIFGILKAGGIFVVINARVTPDHAAAVAHDSGARILIGRETLPDIQSAMRGRSRRHCRSSRAETDVAALIYTSGSTGEPKGVMLTHRNLTAAAEAISSYLGNTEDDVVLNALPLAFSYGLGQLTTVFRVGGTVVLERSFAYPRAIVDTMVCEQVTGLPLVPTIATLLLNQPIGPRVPSLRYVTNAAAALAPAKLHGLLERFPGTRLFSMYGQTECQRASYLPPEQLAVRPESVGIPIPGTTAIVVDDFWRRVPPGVVGELIVRGPHVMAGYWNRPAATASVLRPAGSGERELQTGDLFRADADGFLYFVARADDLIKVGGEKVAPTEIEHVIAELPSVADVAVFGVPDDVLGEVVAAAITPMPGMTISADDVRRHCHRHLESFKVPRAVSVHASLPTTHTGKMSRRALRAAALAAGRPA
jgi:long-chain acyl-CoA synthetase